MIARCGRNCHADVPWGAQRGTAAWNGRAMAFMARASAPSPGIELCIGKVPVVLHMYLPTYLIPAEWTVSESHGKSPVVMLAGFNG